MQCERLIGLAKSWYTSVRNETMAPARMVQFIKQHVSSCSVCQEDPDIKDEIVRITEIVLPDSKIPKAVRMKREQEDAARREAEEDEEDEDADDEEDEEFVDDLEENEDPLSEEEEL